MAIHEIRVFQTGYDPDGHVVTGEAKRTLGLNEAAEVKTVRVYRLQGVDTEEARFLAGHLLADSITEAYEVDQGSDLTDPNRVEVAYKPGVMDPVAASIKKAAEDLGVKPEAVSSSTEYSFSGLAPSEVREVVSRLLVNRTVQHVVFESPQSLTFEGSVGPVEFIPIAGAAPDQLAVIAKKHDLTFDEAKWKAVKDHFKKLGREPKDCELHLIDGRWSEHCVHETFNAKVIVDGQEKSPLFDRIKSASRQYFGDFVVSAFEDNSGVIRFYDGMALCGKVETHNSPSALEPYGGAMTGSGGVFRDIMGTGQGAKTIISTDMFCFASPDIDESLLPPGTLHPDYLQRRVVQGVRDYGNRMGIPTANGSIHYDNDFRAKPSVIVGAYGILPESRAQKGESRVGDLVVAIGGRTGRDGIHGATFSSIEMTDRTSNIHASAVQIGNAIEEKRMFDALLEARDLDCIRAMTDCGAAGFSSAIGEMAENIGATVDISLAPLKYEGLAPWEIWMSESQERMVAAISKGNIDAFMGICRKYNVEATVLGEFDGSHTLTVNYGDQNATELDYDFLKNGLPQKTMSAKWERSEVDGICPEVPETSEEWIRRLKAVLSHGNIASKEAVVRQYDHGVQGGNIVSPYGGVTQEGPNDALVIRPLLDKPYGVVQSHGMNPVLNRLDPYWGSVWAVTEAMANYVAVGGNPDEVALINNYIWPSPDERAMGSLDMSVDAVVDMMHVLKAPVVSGKDSLSSTYKRRDENGKVVEVIEIPPVLCMSAFGRIPDIEKTATSDIKKTGSQLYLVGQPSHGMGGSTYYEVSGGSSSDMPKIDKEMLMPTFRAIFRGIQGNKIVACHDVSEGGVLTTISEMCFGGDCGADIAAPQRMLPYSTDRPDEALFNETTGCFVVELAEGANPFQVFGSAPYTFLGTTTERRTISVKDDYRRNLLFEVPTEDLKKAWQAPIGGIFV